MTTIIMYALKCNNGYIKMEADGFQIVDMQKASVFKSISDLPSLINATLALERIKVVELTITEREINLPSENR